MKVAGVSNWKTSLIGLVGAFLQVLFASSSGGFPSKEVLITAATTALIGLAAKDHNVTGGTTPNN